MSSGNESSPDGKGISSESREEKEREEQPQRKRESKAPDEQFCASCGEKIKKEAAICPECGVKQSHGQERMKSPGIAALASFIITGAGQIYNGQIIKGVGLFVLQIINVMLIAVLIGFITLPLTWAYSIYDAYKTSERINNGDITV